MLHDLGEMYVNPIYLQSTQPLDVAGYRHVAVHPRIDGQLAATLVQAEAIEAEAATRSPTVRRVSARAGHLLFRLRTGWNEMGLWAAEADGASPEMRFELGSASRELAYRMRFIHRDCLWAEQELTDADAAELAPLWASLEPVASN